MKQFNEQLGYECLVYRGMVDSWIWGHQFRNFQHFAVKDADMGLCAPMARMLVRYYNE